MKNLTITQKQYNEIAEINSNSTCLAVATEKIMARYGIDNNSAHKLSNAVRYNYKYLKVKD